VTLFPTTSIASWGPPGDRTSTHRYTLTRRWAPGRTLVVIGVNPSTATETEDDATIRRCIRFARDAGFGSYTMLNLFAFRSTDIRGLHAAADPMGAQNDGAILVECLSGDPTVVCAWGPPSKVPKPLRARFTEVPAILRQHEVELHVFRLTQERHPMHPLYLPATCRPTPWEL